MNRLVLTVATLFSIPVQIATQSIFDRDLVPCVGFLPFIGNDPAPAPTNAPTPRPTSGFTCLNDENCAEDENEEGCYILGENGGVVSYVIVDVATTFTFSFEFRFPQGLTAEILLKSSNEELPDHNLPASFFGLTNEAFEPYADGMIHAMEIAYNSSTLFIKCDIDGVEVFNADTGGNVAFLVGDTVASFGLGANQTQTVCAYNDTYIEL